MIGGGIIALAIGIGGAILSDWNQGRKRRKFVRKFERDVESKMPKAGAAILDEYKTSGEGFLLTLCELMRDSVALSKAIDLYGKDAPVQPEFSTPEDFPADIIHRDFNFGGESRRRVTRFLISSEILSTSDAGSTIVDADSLDFVNRFESFLLALDPKRMKRKKFLAEVQKDVETGTPVEAQSRPAHE